MSESDSEKSILRRFKDGSKEAANELIGKYFERVRLAAEKRLAKRSARLSGPDDIAASVFESLWQRAKENRFKEEELGSYEELWRLLAKMIQFKTDDHARRAIAKKRGGGQVRGDSVFGNAEDTSPGFDNQPGQAFTPDQLMELQEGCTELMSKLNDENLQQIAVMRLEDYSVAEIASHFDRSERWVKRKLAIIREIWSEQEDV